MFRAIGIGYSRSLPAAAALNWLLKEGLGRLSRCIYTASLASAFDTNLKVWLLLHSNIWSERLSSIGFIYIFMAWNFFIWGCCKHCTLVVLLKLNKVRNSVIWTPCALECDSFRLQQLIYLLFFHLKRVRFSTSVLFSLSLGVELLTPAFPQYFLVLASLANMAKQISLACYLATGVRTETLFLAKVVWGWVLAPSHFEC